MSRRKPRSEHKRARGQVKGPQAPARTSSEIVLSWLPAVGVGAAALTVFLLTLAPTVTAEDSGELITAAWHFGIAHPPGYPVWTMLCGLFTACLPFEPIAYRANLFSAVCSAAAAMAAYAALRELRLSRPTAAAGALIWIWSRWSWSQSVITEVYALNSLITAGLLWSVLRWYRTRNTRALLISSVLMGLGMANHHVIALAGLALVVWILVIQPRLVLRWRLVLGCIGMFVLGLLPYVYLPMRANLNPPMNWGNPSDWSSFIAHVTRQQYGAVGPMKTPDPRSLPRYGKQLLYVGESLADDLTPWLVGVAVLGLVPMTRRDWRLLLLVALWLACTGALFALLSNYDFDRTSRWVMRVFLISVPLGLAIPFAYLLEYLCNGIRRLAGQRRAPAGVIVAVLAAAAPAWLLAAHWSRCDYSNYWYAQDHAENMLKCMLAPDPPHRTSDSMIFPSGDHNTFPLVYLVMVEGRRPDLVIADIYGYIRPELLRDMPKEPGLDPAAWLITSARRPVYYTTKQRPPVPNAEYVPAGILYHLLPNNMTFDREGLFDRCTYRNIGDDTVARAGDRGAAGGHADGTRDHTDGKDNHADGTSEHAEATDDHKGDTGEHNGDMGDHAHVADAHADVTGAHADHIGTHKGIDTVHDLGAMHIQADEAFFGALEALRVKDTALALRRFERAAEIGWGIKEVFNNIGSALGEHGMDRPAIGYFKQAAALDRWYTLPRWNLMRVYKKLGRWEEARDALEEIIRVEPENARAHTEMGFLLRDHLGEPEMAQVYWNRSLQLNPAQPEVMQALNELYLDATRPRQHPGMPTIPDPLGRRGRKR